MLTQHFSRVAAGCVNRLGPGGRPRPYSRAPTLQETFSVSISGTLMTTLTYLPQVFDVLNMQSAREVILTHEGAASAEERWVTETPYVADLIEKSLRITPETVLIDYGCGIGRLAKELITRHRCRVIGIDISINMRALAIDYVRSDRFFACSPEM